MLIWKTQEPGTTPGPVKQEQGFSWDAWYAKNRARLSEKRARRYREDPAYRNAALKRSRAQRGTKKAPVQGPYTVSFNDAAQDLDVTVWVLREWRRKNYFPEPHHAGGRLWFTPQQVSLLAELKHFFRVHGARVTESTRGQVDSLVSLTYANW